MKRYRYVVVYFVSFFMVRVEQISKTSSRKAGVGVYVMISFNLIRR
jgi:hypothetical protein